MKQSFFTLENTLKSARAGRIVTDHGVIETPMFMPVGTKATVKALDTQDLVEYVDPDIILGNTYHLYMRPGLEVMKEMGGIHGMMGWERPLLTDSGGFQVFSLGEQKTAKGEGSNVKIDEDGVTFKSVLDGSMHRFTPEKAMEIQRILGADVVMAFDECTPDQATLKYSREALARTHWWAERCVADWEKSGRKSEYGHYQALVGIVQGALHKDLRRESAEFMASLPFDGVAVGGETIGYNMDGTAEVMEWIEDLLPQDKPRYAMGLGRDPENIVAAVKMGFDIFDCVAPTRLARNGTLYFGHLETTGDDFSFVSPFSKGRLQIGRAEFRTDKQVIQPASGGHDACDCYTCTRGYTRAYLHHLYRSDELTYYRLASLHNVRFMVRLARQVRAHIQQFGNAAQQIHTHQPA